MEHMKLKLDSSKMGWPSSFSIASLGQQKTHGQLTAANEISSVYNLYLFVCFLETIQMLELEPIIFICMLEVGSCHFGGFPSKMIKTNFGGVLTSDSFCTCPLYFAWVFLSYLMPSHFIGILSLGPCILFYFLGVPPPRHQTVLVKYILCRL